MNIISLRLRLRVSLVATALLVLVAAPQSSWGQTSVADQYGLAAGHYERGEYEQSASGFRELIRQFPHSPQAALSHFFLGESLVQQQDYQAAFPAFEIFIKHNTDRGQDVYVKRAKFRLAECAYQLNWSEQSVSLLEAFIQQYANDSLNDFALNYLGETRLKRGEPQLARQVFQQALKQFPQSPQSNRHRFGMAKSLAALGNKSEAIRFFSMLTVDPHDPLFGLAAAQAGIIQFSDQQFSQAKLNLLAAVGSPISEPSRVEAKYWLARTELALDQHEVAWQLFQEIAEASVDGELKSAILFDGAIAASRSGEPQSALGWLRRLQTTWPDSKWSDDALQLEIELLYQQRMYDEALQKITIFIDLFNDHGNLPIVLEYQGRIYYNRGQYDKTVEAFQTLLDRFGSDTERADQTDSWRYLLGLGYLGLREFELATAQFAKIQMQHTEPVLRSSILLAEASASIGMKRPDRAVPLLDRYLATNPRGTGADRARSDLVIACAQTGDWNRAQQTLLDLEQNHLEKTVYLDSILLLAELALHDRQYDFAETFFGKLVNPTLPRKYVVRGMSGIAWARMSRGDETSAVEVFENLIAEFPETTYAAESAMACGRYLEQNDDFARAIEMYELVQSRFAESDFAPQAKLRQAHNLYRTGGAENLKSAEQLLQQLQTMESEKVDEALYQLAWIYLETDRAEMAVALFTRISEGWPGSRYWTDATYRIAENAMSTGDFELADKLINRLQSQPLVSRIDARTTFLESQIAIHHQQWTRVAELSGDLLAKTDDELLRKKARYWLAESMFQQGSYDAAYTELQRLIGDPNLITAERLAWVHLRRTQCLAYQDQWTSALDLAQAGRKQFPEFEALHEFDFIIGRAHAAQGRLADARTAFQKVVDSATGRTTQTAAMAQWRIGETWFHQQDYQQAIEAYYRVDSLYAYEKWQAAALVEAGKCQEHLGNWKQARNLYQQLLDRFPESEYCLTAQQRLGLANRQSKSAETITK